MCLDCYECHTSDKSDLNCHDWVKSANSPALNQCDMCAIKTDKLIACIVCDCSVCESCINTVTLQRFFACGVYETICNACIPPDACADPDGLTAKTIGSRKCTFCLICQEYHEDVSEGVVDCDIDLHEHSPLARLCIESLALAKAEKAKKSTKKGREPQGSKFQPENADQQGCTAREIQRDNMLLEMQVKIQEMEKNLSQQIEKSLNLKMMDLEKNLGLQNENSNSHEKCVQTDKNDLRAAEVLFKAHKARENPTQAILDTLPKIIETITNSFEKKYRFQNTKEGRQNHPNPREEQRARQQRSKTHNRRGPDNKKSGRNSQ